MDAVSFGNALLLLPFFSSFLLSMLWTSIDCPTFSLPANAKFLMGSVGLFSVACNVALVQTHLLYYFCVFVCLMCLSIVLNS